MGCDNRRVDLVLNLRVDAGVNRCYLLFAQRVLSPLDGLSLGGLKKEVVGHDLQPFRKLNQFRRLFRRLADLLAHRNHKGIV